MNTLLWSYSILSFKESKNTSWRRTWIFWALLATAELVRWNIPASEKQNKAFQLLAHLWSPLLAQQRTLPPHSASSQEQKKKISKLFSFSQQSRWTCPLSLSTTWDSLTQTEAGYSRQAGSQSLFFTCFGTCLSVQFNYKSQGEWESIAITCFSTQSYTRNCELWTGAVYSAEDWEGSCQPAPRLCAVVRSAAFLLPFDKLGKFHIFYVLTFVGYLVFYCQKYFLRCYGYGLANEQKYQVSFMPGTILKSFLSFFLCLHFIGPAQTSDDKSKMPKTYI